MKKFLAFIPVLSLLIACNSSTKGTSNETGVDSVATNIKTYSRVWDEIMNDNKIENFNESNFTKDVVLYSTPSNITGIDSMKAFYSEYLKGFSDISFTIKDIFGMGNKLVKHWNFKGTNSGEFFGLPPTGAKVDLDGVTLVEMKDGKIAAERDFIDNMDFNRQMGITPRDN